MLTCFQEQKQSRNEKREERRRTQLQSVVEEDVPDCDEGWRMEDRRNEAEKHELEISSEELKNLQAMDSTLEKLEGQ